MRKEELLLQITFINVGNGDAILIAARFLTSGKNGSIC